MFAEITKEDLITKHAKVQWKNTKKGEVSAQRQFKFKETSCDATEFWLLEVKELDLHLSKF